ncbi:MAG TPA: 50S ribosomal protein L4 [Desulfurococcales archaeon]|nr:50S ribosomal protein L4 [Desulfurococcales archaeon]
MSTYITLKVPFLTLDLKRPVYDLNGNPVEEIELPPLFTVPVRIDLIRRAFLSAFTARLQPKGRDPMAGKRTSARSFGVGLGLARIPRERQTGRGRFVVSTVGGRRAFPPTPLKKIHEEINKKERRLALISALAATANRYFVEKRGHAVVPEKPPIIVVDDIVNIQHTRDLKEVLKKLNLWEDVVRAQRGTKIKAGKGKMRGRRYKTPVSILIVAHDTSKLLLAGRNLPGLDIVTPQQLSILHLAPGGVPGRLTIYTKTSLQILNEKFPVKTI